MTSITEPSEDVEETPQERPSGDGPGKGGEGQDGRGPGRRWPLIASWALLVASAVFLSWSCWMFVDMRLGGAQDMARDRDRAMTAAKQQIAALNTMDARRVDQGLRSWLDASTGPLHDELKRTAGRNRQQIQRSGTSATGTVSDAALTALDRRAGTARVIATVRIEISRPGAATTVQRKRFDAALTRTAEGWKLKSLTALPAGTR
jgi:Mce-associated membrane protein